MKQEVATVVAARATRTCIFNQWAKTLKKVAKRRRGSLSQKPTKSFVLCHDHHNKTIEVKLDD